MSSDDKLRMTGQQWYDRFISYMSEFIPMEEYKADELQGDQTKQYYSVASIIVAAKKASNLIKEKK